MGVHSDWELITPDNLPEDGDLVLSRSCAFVMRVQFRGKWTYEEWTDPEQSDWRWKAKLNLPREIEDANRKNV